MTMEVSVSTVTHCAPVACSNISSYLSENRGVSRKCSSWLPSRTESKCSSSKCLVISPSHDPGISRERSSHAQAAVRNSVMSKRRVSWSVPVYCLARPSSCSNFEIESKQDFYQKCFVQRSGELADKKHHDRKGRRWAIVSSTASVGAPETYVDEADFNKAGGKYKDLVQLQAKKPMNQPKIGQRLQPIRDELLDLIVVGCGPAGVSLAAEAARQGLRVGLVGPDLPFTNNYGVWEDEFAALGLENCIEQTWRDAAMYFESDTPLLIGRAYGRVDRRLLHEELLKRCADAGVQYLDAEVDRISDSNENGSTVMCASGELFNCRLVTVASGAAAGRFLEYEPGGPGVTVQTAYGMEVEVENFTYDPEVMLFMDYRDYKAWGTENCSDAEEFKEVPSFLYAMPVSSTRVFFEETCLAARPTMPFNLLKERLLIRLEKMRIKVTHLYEEEWSYIPVGATLPDTSQQHLGFGAAAGMIHPASGYSVVRSLSEAPAYAAAIAAALRAGRKYSALHQEWKHPRAAALEAWNALWPMERKRQRAFFLFGLELIVRLDLAGIREFFATFFELPEWLWKGFLAAKLSSLDLIWFAMITFVVAPNTLRFRLVRHLMSDPSGSYLWRTYLGLKTAPKTTPLLPADKSS